MRGHITLHTQIALSRSPESSEWPAFASAWKHPPRGCFQQHGRSRVPALRRKELASIAESFTNTNAGEAGSASPSKKAADRRRRPKELPSSSLLAWERRGWMHTRGLVPKGDITILKEELFKLIDKNKQQVGHSRSTELPPSWQWQVQLSRPPHQFSEPATQSLLHRVRVLCPDVDVESVQADVRALKAIATAKGTDPIGFLQFFNPHT